MKLKLIEGNENDCPVLKGEGWRLELFRGYYFQMLFNGLTIQSRLNFETEIKSAFAEEIEPELVTFCHLISAFRADKNLLIDILEDDEASEILVNFVNESLEYYYIKEGHLDDCTFDVPPEMNSRTDDEFFRNVLEAYNRRYVITKEGFMFVTDPRFKENVEYLGVDYEEARKLFLSRDMKEVGVKSNDNSWIRKILEVNGLLESEVEKRKELYDSLKNSPLKKDNPIDEAKKETRKVFIPMVPPKDEKEAQARELLSKVQDYALDNLGEDN